MITLSHFRSLEELIHALERERKQLQGLSFYEKDSPSYHRCYDQEGYVDWE